MPELHGLMPPLGAMLDEGHRIALLTDGRLSGASGKVLSALHLWPEAAKGGPLARIRDGDIIHIDARKGVLDIEPVGEPFEARTPAPPDGHAAYGVGRELFALFRRNVSQAEAGASPLFDDAPSASPAVVSATLRNREVTA
jgi:phosphogluconate dehydratase